MFSARKRRCLTGMTDTSSSSVIIPDVTGDAVARYEKDSHSGSTWYDLISPEANGTDNGPALAFPRFNGAEWIAIGQPVKLDFAGAFSVSLWASQDGDAAHSFERLISRDNNTDRSFLVSQHDNSGNPFFGIFVSGGLKSVQGGGAFDDGLWHHYGLINEGAGGDLLIYIDGVLHATGAGNGGAMDIDPADLEVGRAQNASRYLEGRCDTARLYSRALSADEILRDYHAGKPAHS